MSDPLSAVPATPSMCLLGMGSNQGDSAVLLDQAVEAMQADPRLTVHAVSAYHATDPVGGPAGQSPFLNAAVRISTSESPRTLLQMLQQWEAVAGRQRTVRWGERTLDLDLLIYGELVATSPLLTLPHSRMAFRRFVLESGAEAAPEMLHPSTGWTVAQLLDHLNTSPYWLAIEGCNVLAPIAKQAAARLKSPLVMLLDRSDLATLPEALEQGALVLSFGKLPPMQAASAGSPSPRLTVVAPPAALDARVENQIVDTGPTLRLESGQEDYWLEEIIAAALAMK